MEIDPQFTPLDAVQPSLMGSNLSESVAEAHQIIEDARRTYPHVAVIALFSGGNDSTTLLHLVKDQIDFALHINTGIGIEQTREFVRDTCSTWGVRLVEKKTPPEEYIDRVVKHGFPGPVQHRVMYIMLKERRLAEARRELLDGVKGKRIILLSGVRSYESVRRMGDGRSAVSRQGNLVWVNPLHHWDDWNLYQYRQTSPVPRNPVSDRIHKSGECLCGAYAKKGELDELEMWFPHVGEQIHDLERKVREVGHGARSRWGWGADFIRPMTNAPGPMCSSCHRFEQTEMEIPA